MDLDELGIYMIKNLINNKVYIGSTERSFKVRWKKHVRMLDSNKHHNKHLQNSWNKYLKENFEFSILEITNSNVFSREEYFIAFYNSGDRLYGYNDTICPTLSPSLQLSTQLKISKTLKEGYSSGRIKISSSTFKKGLVPWNKGINFSNPISKVNKRLKLNTVDVFDINHKFLGNWGSAPNLYDFSKNDINYFGDILYALGINRACKSLKSYKNLYFKYAPLVSDN